MQDKIKKILLEVNKPARYVGQEIGSSNKNWDLSSVKTVLAFPDLYEVGISNLGFKILYHLINKNSQDFLADRVYAPAPDFREKLAENEILLYGVESFKSLKDFDIVAFTFQYELNYPTVLAMLEMSNIPIKSADRQEDFPLVIAGGPACYNPESMTDFIDVFVIGDGEESIIEILEEVKKAKLINLDKTSLLKNLAKIEGIYVPGFYKISEESLKPYPVSPEFPEAISKRISDLNKDYPVDFPLPYINAVHDRAVIEIRRGCGRMCRFCQPCFVNLPIRERDPETIVDITDKILKNTGYDEYSLLSLSSSDYKNIKDLVCVLNQTHSKTGTSISLPSQRADAFSLELAQLVQSVRKSTLTFAPEAGSQRLRDVINKNLNEDQIMNSILSAYQAGWSNIKLYFMIGLPTETFEDLDEIVNLLERIKRQGRALKSEFNLNKNLDITCTISNFVPKPFTPFQWVKQDSIESINEKIKYLREKSRHLRGVKLNFNDALLSQLEALFSRGDRKLNKLIELVYQKGAYLDAWDEYFKRNVWQESIKELNINLENYFCKNSFDSELPWDIINIGVDKNWLSSEANKAMEVKTSTPCDESCTNCGVCSSFKKNPVLKSNIPIKTNKNILEINKEQINFQQDSIHKYRLKFQKIGNLKYISHLDWQRLIHRAIKKADIKVSFTQGFNPSPKISIGIALPLFVESLSEYVDIEIKEKMQENYLLEKLNQYLPENSKVTEIIEIPKNDDSIDFKVNWAEYSARPIDISDIQEVNLEQVIKDLDSKENIFLEKSKSKNKGSKKIVDIKPLINSIQIKDEASATLGFVLKAGQQGNFRPDDFVKILTPDIKWDITREKMFDCNFKELI